MACHLVVGLIRVSEVLPLSQGVHQGRYSGREALYSSHSAAFDDPADPVFCHGHARTSVLRRTLPINICAGDMLSPVTGVFLSDSSTRCGSVPVCMTCFSAYFTVLMDCSAIPFDEGKPGLECELDLP